MFAILPEAVRGLGLDVFRLEDVPIWASKIGVPPFLIISFTVGTIFFMRVASVTFPSTIGTLRSTRVRTRFPCKSIWQSVFQDITFTQLKIYAFSTDFNTTSSHILFLWFVKRRKGKILEGVTDG